MATQEWAGRPVNELIRELQEARQALHRQGQELADAQQALESTRRLAQFPEENPNPVLRVAADGELLYANLPARRWLLTLGWEPGEPLPAAVRTVVTDARTQGRAVEHEIRNPAGTTFRLSAVQPPDEGYVNIYGIDITARKRAEEEREATIGLLERLFESAPLGIAVVSGPEHRYELANPTYEAIPGMPDVPLLGQRLASIFPDVAEQAALDLIDEVYRSGKTVSVREFKATIGQDSAPTYWNVTHVPLPGPHGEVERVLILTQDVTEGVLSRRQVEEVAGQAQQQAAEVDAILESMVEAVIVYDYADRPVRANHAARAAYGAALDGHDRPEVIRLINLRHMDGRPVALADSPVDRALRGQVVQGDRFLFAHAAKGDRIMAASAAPVHQGDRALGAVGVWHDVTDQVQAESQREAALQAMTEAKQALERRNRELQALTAELEAYDHTVAHDLKNPLFKIIGMADLLAETVEDMAEEAPRKMLRGILDGSQRMRDIVDSLLLLSSVRSQEVAPGSLDMAEIVAQAQQELAPAIEQSHAQIVTPEDWPVARGYAPWVRSVWTNYLSNALKYGGQNPRIELGAAVEPPAGQEQGGRMVRFWVRDHGPGLTADQQACLFVAFSRLDRPEELGHGLGLTIVRRVVEKLGGQVGVDSRPGEGTTFWFTLPANGAK